MIIDLSTVQGYGVDVSHHQDPARLPWNGIRNAGVDFCIARGAYGREIDRAAAGHIAHARNAGMRVGLYIFWRPKQTAEEQITALARVAEEAGIGAGDVVPAIDVESNDVSGERAEPGWNDGAKGFCELIEKFVSRPPIIYMSRTTWILLDRPEWPLHFPLWVPDYAPGASLRSPWNMSPLIWQHRVSEWEADRLGEGGYDEERPYLDQDRRFGPLPTIGDAITEEDREKVRALVAENLRKAVQEPDDEDVNPGEGSNV